MIIIIGVWNFHKLRNIRYFPRLYKKYVYKNAMICFV